MNYATKPISWDKIEKALAAIRAAGDKESLLLLGIAVFTAYRCSDWRKLKWGELAEFSGNNFVRWRPSVLVVQQKTTTKRKVALGPSLIDILNYCYNGQHPGVLLFKGSRGPASGPISVNGANDRLSAICQKYGLEHSTTHSLRKSLATHFFLSNGGDFQALMLSSKMLGHSKLETTMVYLGIHESKITNFFNKL